MMTYDILLCSPDYVYVIQENADQSWAHGDSHIPDQVLQGIAHTSLPYYGVQFHPESIGTAFGFQLLQNFHDLTAEHHGLQLPIKLPKQLPEKLPGQVPAQDPQKSAAFKTGQSPVPSLVFDALLVALDSSCCRCL